MKDLELDLIVAAKFVRMDKTHSHFGNLPTNVRELGGLSTRSLGLVVQKSNL